MNNIDILRYKGKKKEFTAEYKYFCDVNNLKYSSEHIPLIWEYLQSHPDPTFLDRLKMNNYAMQGGWIVTEQNLQQVSALADYYEKIIENMKCVANEAVFSAKRTMYIEMVNHLRNSCQTSDINRSLRNVFQLIDEYIEELNKSGESERVLVKKNVLNDIRLRLSRILIHN